MSAIENLSRTLDTSARSSLSTLPKENTVTKISIKTRIDYILRFSQQAIVVVDESKSQPTHVANQFLASIPEQHNAAYVPISAKFNDIQVRCRIIEQLDSKLLFDPEKSLAVTIIDLAKKSQQPISIVLDHCQHLSLQIFHEVAQASKIAKKNNLTVNIVMFGTSNAGKKIVNNKSLFYNQLAILSAQTGQLLTSKDPLFQSDSNTWKVIFKWSLISLFALILASAGFLLLNQYDGFTFTDALKDDSATVALPDKPQAIVMASEKLTSQEKTSTLPQQAATTESKNNNDTVELAKTQDIYQLLTISSVENEAEADRTENAEQVRSRQNHQAEQTALTNNEQQKSADLPADETLIANKKGEQKQGALQNKVVDKSYFQQYQQGYVLQIATAKNIDDGQAFLNNLALTGYLLYQRSNAQALDTVIISQVFASKQAALNALSELPAALADNKPFIKSIRWVQREVNQ